MEQALALFEAQPAWAQAAIGLAALALQLVAEGLRALTAPRSNDSFKIET